MIIGRLSGRARTQCGLLAVNPNRFAAAQKSHQIEVNARLTGFFRFFGGGNVAASTFAAGAGPEFDAP